LELWDLEREMFPIANSISEKIINLPTALKKNAQVLEFLTKHLDLIE
jgi:hypothetical protein